MKKSLHFAFTIIGDGLVALSAAALLAELKLPIAIIFPPQASPQPDQRPLTLNQNSRSILQHLELWPKLRKHAAPLHRVIVRQKNCWGRMYFSTQEFALEALGYSLSLAALHEALQARLQAQSHVALLTGSLTDLKPYDAGWCITLETEGLRQMTSDWLLGCDGHHSLTRRLLGGEWRQSQRPSAALSYVVEGTVLTPATGHIIATDYGIVAALPTASPQSLKVVVTLSAHLDLDTLNLEQVESKLYTDCKTFINPISHLRRISDYQYRVAYCPRPLWQRAVLLGNAARVFPAFLAQSFNSAFNDCYVVSRYFTCLIRQSSQDYLFKRDDKLKSCDDLSFYQALSSQQQANQTLWHLANAGLALLQNAQNPIGSSLRAAALAALDLSPLKRYWGQLCLGQSLRTERQANLVGDKR